MNLTDIEVLLFLHHLPCEKVHFTEMERMLKPVGRKELYASLDRLQVNRWIEKDYESGLPRTLLISLTNDGKKEAKTILNRIGKYCIPVHNVNPIPLKRKTRQHIEAGEEIRTTVINAVVDEHTVSETIKQKIAGTITSALLDLFLSKANYDTEP